MTPLILFLPILLSVLKYFIKNVRIDIDIGIDKLQLIMKFLMAATTGCIIIITSHKKIETFNFLSTNVE